MTEELLVPRDHRNPRGQRVHRGPKAGRPELRIFLRCQPFRFRQPEPTPIEAPQAPEARVWKGPCVAAPTARKLRRLDVRARRRSNRGAYSGQ